MPRVQSRTSVRAAPSSADEAASTVSTINNNNQGGPAPTFPYTHPATSVSVSGWHSAHVAPAAALNPTRAARATAALSQNLNVQAVGFRTAAPRAGTITPAAANASGSPSPVSSKILFKPLAITKAFLSDPSNRQPLSTLWQAPDGLVPRVLACTISSTLTKHVAAEALRLYHAERDYARIGLHQLVLVMEEEEMLRDEERYLSRSKAKYTKCTEC
ncbi:hypothetical protein ColTof4_14337 [Colletotrichum tofieldiae]|nr:hypothetical protein ColTof3_14748 [Colletotrichum tofieldiae]GKT81914.1 hypothetical protein ColTof4_14337 [Colletotrichum tofieldiae]